MAGEEFMQSNGVRSDTSSALDQAVRGKVVYLLALMVLVQSAYPITLWGTGALALYQLLYASMIVAGVIVGRDSPRHALWLGVAGAVYLGAGLVYSFNPTARWAVFMAYVALVPYLTLLTSVLVRFVFAARTITRDVLYAATAVYVLLGAIFVPLYGFLETVAPGAIRDGSTPDLPLQWQQLIYFSYTTLTTAGYGDVLPVSAWARVVANVEMVVGVLYLTVIMARLVGLYSSERQGDMT